MVPPHWPPGFCGGDVDVLYSLAGGVTCILLAKEVGEGAFGSQRKFWVQVVLDLKVLCVF